MTPMSLLHLGAPLTAAAHGCPQHITYAEAGIVGLIQGVTELFPVSSLGHNVLLPALVGGCWSQNLSVAAPESPYLAFIVGLHVATAIALLVYFWRDWIRIIKGFFTSLGQIISPEEGTSRWDLRTDERLAWLIILGTIPVGLAGLAFEHAFRTIFGKPAYAAVFLIINGLILIAGERFRRQASLDADEEIAAEREYALQGARGGQERYPREQERHYRDDDRYYQDDERYYRDDERSHRSRDAYQQDEDAYGHYYRSEDARGRHYQDQDAYGRRYQDQDAYGRRYQDQDARGGRYQDQDDYGRYYQDQGARGGRYQDDTYGWDEGRRSSGHRAEREEEIENNVESDERLAAMGVAQAVVIGSAQILALLAGISRDGIAIVGGMARGLSREDAARFAFLLATPVILAAGALKIPDLMGPFGNGIRGQVVLGSILSGIGAYVAVRFLTRYFMTRTMIPFGIYCLIAGFGSLVYLEVIK